MSGFCGLIYKHPVPAGSDADFRLRQQLAQLMRGVASRGPHASDSWVSGRVGLGHHLLREVPEAEREAQPLASADGRFIIVFDGRIDNRDEIFANLDNHLRPRIDCSDVEIVLAAHQCWREDAPRRLLGDFAYAAWDTVEQLLVGVRDPLAGRPFYYVDRDEYFAFASHDEALLSLPGISSAPNQDHLASLFVPRLDDYDQFASWYANVNVLHPGYRLRFKHGRSVAKFGHGTISCMEPFPFSSNGEAVEAFESVLRVAVSARLRTYGPAAMLLSGGIDSASVITAARSLISAAKQEPIRTYSALSDDEATCVESQAIRVLIESGPCSPTIVRTPSFHGGLSPDVMAKLVWDQADPISNSLIMHMPLFTRASADGCTSVLNGTGGDLVTAVPGYYASRMIREGRWRDAWRESQAIAANNTYLRHMSPQEIFLRGMLASMPDSVKVRVRQAIAALRIRAKSDIRFASKIFSANFLAKTNLPSRLRASKHAEPRITMFDAALGQDKSIDWLAHGQKGYDRVAGRFGLTSRDVWSDLRLVQFYFRLPVALRTDGGWTKSLVRRYLRLHGLPTIANRSDKQHIGWTFSDRLLAEHSHFPATVITSAEETFNAKCLSSLNLKAGVRNQQPQLSNEQNLYLKSSLSWLCRLGNSDT